MLAFAAGASSAFNNSMMSTVGTAAEKPNKQTIRNVDGSEKTSEMLAEIENIFLKEFRLNKVAPEASMPYEETSFSSTFPVAHSFSYGN